jgi:hypothetical protein
MKVAKLIKKLQEFDQNALVIMNSGNFEKGQDLVDTTSVWEATAKKVVKYYRDAFDGEGYSGSAYYVDPEGSIKIVRISA